MSANSGTRHSRTLHVAATAAGLVAFTRFSPALAVESVQLKTPRGAPIEVLEEKPPGPGPFPVLVLASGQGYHMRLPILERLAQTFVREGIAVIRFNWAYFVKDGGRGAQSKDRSAEIEDMTAVLSLARREAWADKQRILVGGKSLGSIIAWRVLRASPDVRAAVLLTPVCSPPDAAPGAAESNYPSVAAEPRPSAWIAGDRDPICRTPALYHLLGSAAATARIDVVSGDHAFESSPSSDKPAADVNPNVELVTRLAIDFARAALKEPPVHHP